MHSPPRRAARTLPALLLAFLLASITAPAAAQDEDRTLTARELGLAVNVGYSGDISLAGWTPVEVRLEPTRLFGGTLTIVTGTDVSEVLEQRDVEVAAGTEKVFRFVVPPANRIQIRISEVGREPLVSNPSLPARRGNTFLVGVLGDTVPASAPPVAAVASDIRGAYGAIDPAWLDVSPRALDAVSTLVLTHTQLQQLGAEAQANLRNQVAMGMELVVVADRPGAIDLDAAGIPWSPVTTATATTVTAADGGRDQAVLALTPATDAWSLRADDLAATTGDAVLAAAVNAGRGRVSMIGVGLGDAGLGGDARLWGHVLQPAARSLELSDAAAGLNRPVRLATEAVRSRGLSLPSLPWLTIFLVAFVLLVGPLNGFVLSRIGRPELAWLTIPAITVVFATGAYAGARGAQPPVGLAATASMWVDGQGQELAISAVRTPREGDQTVRFAGQGWSVLPAVRTATPARIDRSGDDTNVTLQLGALQVGSLLAWRPTEAAPPLDVTATVIDADTIEVTVTNTTDRPIETVEIRAGTHVDRLGSLEAGATETRSVSGLSTLPTREPWQEDFEGMRDMQGVPVAPKSLEAVLRWQGFDGNPGLVWAVGTTAERLGGQAAANAAGGATDDLGEFFAVGVTPAVDGEAIGPAAVSRALLPVNIAQGVDRNSTLAIGTSGDAILRYRLPGGATPSTLVSTLHLGWDEFGGFEGEFPAAECFEQPVFDEDGNVVGANVVCEDVAIAEPQPFADPDCPPNAECTFDGQLFEICRPIGGDLDDPAAGRECTVQVIAPGVQPPGGGFQGPFQLEVFDHAESRWVFLADAARSQPDGTVTLEPARFLSPLGEVFVRASGELWPFDYSARGIGATLGGSA